MRWKGREVAHARSVVVLYFLFHSLPNLLLLVNQHGDWEAGHVAAWHDYGLVSEQVKISTIQRQAVVLGRWILHIVAGDSGGLRCLPDNVQSSCDVTRKWFSRKKIRKGCSLWAAY